MTTYSKPFTKEEIAEMYTRIYECMPESLKDGFIKRLVKFDDVKLLKNFNKRMNIFAQGGLNEKNHKNWSWSQLCW